MCLHNFYYESVKSKSQTTTLRRWTPPCMFKLLDNCDSDSICLTYTTQALQLWKLLENHCFLDNAVWHQYNVFHSRILEHTKAFFTPTKNPNIMLSLTPPYYSLTCTVDMTIKKILAIYKYCWDWQNSDANFFVKILIIVQFFSQIIGIN